MTSYSNRPKLSVNNTLGGPSYSSFAVGSGGTLGGSVSTVPSADDDSHFTALGKNTPVVLAANTNAVVNFDSFQSNWSTTNLSFTLGNGHWRVDIETEYDAGGGGANFQKPDFFIREPLPSTVVYRPPITGQTVASGTTYFDTETIYLNTFVADGQPPKAYQVVAQNNGASPATITYKKLRVFCTRASTTVI